MYSTVDQVVRAALASKGRTTLHSYVLYLHFALNGLFKLKRDGGYIAKKTEKLKVNSRKAVTWPSDMLWYSVIGVPVGGRILTFIPDKSISLNQEDHIGNNESAVQKLMMIPYDNVFDFTNYTNVYLSGGYTPYQGRVGSYVAKHFRVNEEAREFQLDARISCEHVYVEYFTKVTKPNSETLISPLAAPALEEFIHYREARFKTGAASAETKASEQDYLTELDDLMASQSDLTGNGIMDAFSASSKYTIDQ